MFGHSYFRCAALALVLGVLAGCAPTANFTVDKDEGGAPLTVKFTDTSSTLIPFLGNANVLSPIRVWRWDFGDGAISDQRSPTHTYANQGTYTVALTVTSGWGSNTITKPDTIKVTGTATGARANFTATPRTGVAPLTVQFTDTTNAGGVGIVSREWRFGDDTTSTVQNPSHIFEDPGSYTVTLIVGTTVGVTTVEKQDFIVVTETPAGPQASFIEDVTQGNAPLTVMFTDTSSPGDAPITSRLWDFGDGETSSQQSPTHTFDDVGTYTVSLTVTTSLGTATRQKPNLIRVTAPPAG